ncbi:ankyrin-1-like [Phymastichus coffea]|uniref:ankyrin-1-like n=1 Tax=Phymastichus coffea TaxID=108790 RepID=UPI00273C54F3|nr:ankyrin-1-like [Phymastichus coffea]
MAHSIYRSLLEDVRHNDVRSFRSVLEARGLPQDDNWFDYDLLMRALRLNRKRIVSALLDKHCRVNKPRNASTNVNTPLHLAAEKLGWCDIIEKMLRLKARVTDVNADGNTPLHLAFLNQLSDKVIHRLLTHYLKECTTDIPNKDGLGFMHIACTRADCNSLREFFDVGMSDIYSQVSIQSDTIYAGYSPLHFAVKAGRHEIVNFLCLYEADIYAQDCNGSTPIHLALEKGDVKMIDILLYYDSNYENYVNAFGASHFMAACAGSDSNIVEQFLTIAENASSSSVRQLLNGRVKDVPHIPIAGCTALHFACEYGRVNTVYGLLAIGAQKGTPLLCESITSYGLTPYSIATAQQHWDICNVIQQYYTAYQHMLVRPEVQHQAEVHCDPTVVQMHEHQLLQHYQPMPIACA